MVSKGLDFPKVGLVGVMNADLFLHQPDFRASERAFQLLSHIAGRAGRKGQGRVLIQTYNPFPRNATKGQGVRLYGNDNHTTG